jgi:hypothetical protein
MGNLDLGGNQVRAGREEGKLRSTLMQCTTPSSNSPSMSFYPLPPHPAAPLISQAGFITNAGNGTNKFAPHPPCLSCSVITPCSASNFWTCVASGDKVEIGDKLELRRSPGQDIGVGIDGYGGRLRGYENEYNNQQNK